MDSINFYYGLFAAVLATTFLAFVVWIALKWKQDRRYDQMHIVHVGALTQSLANQINNSENNSPRPASGNNIPTTRQIL